MSRKEGTETPSLRKTLLDIHHPEVVSAKHEAAIHALKLVSKEMNLPTPKVRELIGMLGILGRLGTLEAGTVAHNACYNC